MPTTQTRTAIRLEMTHADLAPFLEELLWTLDGVESVTYRHDGEERFLGLEVIAVNPDLASLVAQLCESHGFTPHVQLHPQTQITEEDWAESWKRYWHVHRLLPHVVIRPSWESFTPEATDVVLDLDPGSAFGTGTHSTTQLVLSVMQDLLDQPAHSIRTQLDVGTGSGILAIYGAKRGISSLLATDNDPVAVAVAAENARHNRVDDRLMTSGEALERIQGRRFDLITANILAPVLQEMMPIFPGLLNAGGHLVLSGITRRQLSEMQRSIQQNRLNLKRIVQHGDWLALYCTP